MKLRLLLLSLFFLFWSYRSPADTAAPPKEVWVCPPCGGDCDGLEFDHPGLCPHCGMTLVKKSSLDHQTTVAIVLFDGVEIIDYSGPWEIFGQAHYKVVTVAQMKTPVKTAFGEVVTPDYDFATAPQADILVVPGGNVDDALCANQALTGWIRQASDKANYTLSVCTGAFLMAKAGLLDGLKATTFHGAIDHLKQVAPKTTVIYDQRFVDNGRIVVTAGLTSGMDGALDVVSKVDGLGTAETVALNLEYNWDRKASYARAALADRNLTFSLNGVDFHFLSREGDRTHWRQAIRIKDEASNPQVEGKLNALLASQPRWQRQADGTWIFQDSEGSAWTAISQVKPDPSSSDEHVWTLSIQQTMR